MNRRTFNQYFENILCDAVKRLHVNAGLLDCYNTVYTTVYPIAVRLREVSKSGAPEIFRSLTSPPGKKSKRATDAVSVQDSMLEMLEFLSGMRSVSSYSVHI